MPSVNDPSSRETIKKSLHSESTPLESLVAPPATAQEKPNPSREQVSHAIIARNMQRRQIEVLLGPAPRNATEVREHGREAIRAFKEQVVAYVERYAGSELANRVDHGLSRITEAELRQLESVAILPLVRRFYCFSSDGKREFFSANDKNRHEAMKK